MVKYPFSSKLMFAIVMHDEEACRQFIEKLFPEKKVKEIRFRERNEGDKLKFSRDQSREYEEENGIHPFSGRNEEKSRDRGRGNGIVPSNDRHAEKDENQSQSTITRNECSQRWKDSVAEVEKTIIMGLESKSVRLDVLFEGDDTLYDIEMQVEREECIPRRSRYYHMAMGRNTLRMGENYSELKASYVIFICCYDAFGIDEPIYRFEMFDENLQLKLGDGSSTIILNTKCSEEKIPEKLKAFYNFVDTGKVDSSDKLVSYLDKRVEEANENEEVDRIMTLEEELIIRYHNGLKKGREEGAAQEKREIAKAMKESGAENAYISQITGLSSKEIETL